MSFSPSINCTRTQYFAYKTNKQTRTNVGVGLFYYYYFIISFLESVVIILDLLISIISPIPPPPPLPSEEFITSINNVVDASY